ncbi:MAG: discoidin domain-containing protein [Clostridia bacterium]|nr:discoidin domain-containing protein [Clostridia bacterium]
MKKIFALSLALVMLLSLCGIHTSASSAVCYVDSESNTYESLAEALKKGGEVHLLSDAELDCSAHFYNLNAKIYGHGYTVKVLNGEWHVDLKCNLALYDVTIDLNQKSMVVSGNTTVLTIGKGTTIKNGLANNGGAAIMYVQSKIIMEDGALITDCVANYGGGGIHTHQGTFEMKGGKITNCTGGGVNVAAGSTFIVSGNATVTGNKKADGSTLNVNVHTPIKVTGNLTGRIGVTPKAELENKIGVVEGSATGLNAIVSDVDASLVGTPSGSDVILGNGKALAPVVTPAGNTSENTTVPTGTAYTGEYGNTSDKSKGNVSFDGTGAVCYVDTESNTFDNLKDAIKKGGNIHLLRHAELDTSEHFFSANAVIDGHGYTIKITGGEWHIDLNCIITLKNVTVDLNQKSMVVSGAKTQLTIGKGTTIKNGLANNGGAAIMYVQSKIIMEDGALITDCVANYGGGGIHTHQGTFEMKGGMITNCTGGGVNAASTGTFIVSGGASVTGNKKADGSTLNVNLQTPMKVTGALTGKIGVTPKVDLAGQVGIIEDAVSGATNIVSDVDAGLVGSVDGSKIVLKKSSEAVSGGVAFQETGAACYAGEESNTFASVDEAIRSKSGEIHLLRDAILDCYNNYLGVNAVINGHGHTLKAEAKLSVDVNSDFKLYDVTLDLNQKSILVSAATLTLGKGTTVKNGLADNGGAVLLYSTATKQGTLIMESGSKITDCKANYGGGGVHTHLGTFYMNGGTIENCTGGGVNVPDTSKVVISGDAEIKNNKNASGAAYNLVAKTPDTVTFTGTLTKKIFVSNAFAEGEKIANASNLTGAENIVLDPEEAYIGKVDGDRVVWQKNPNSTAKAPGEGYVPKTGWKVEINSRQDQANRVIDGDTKTFWHSWYRAEAGTIVEKDDLPFIFDVTLPSETVISGIEILPRQDSNGSGVPTKVDYYVEENGEWVLILQGEYPSGHGIKHHEFARNIKTGKIRIKFIEAVANYGTLAEIYLLSENKDLETVAAKDLMGIAEKEALYPLDKSQASVSYDYDWWSNNRIEKVIDGVDASFWQVGTARIPNDFEFTVDLGEVKKMSAISYYPRQSADMDGYWMEYSIMTSTDGVDFVIDVDHAKIATEERHFGRHYSYFDEPIEARYVKFFIHKGKGNIASCGEVDFYEDYYVREERLKAEAEEYKLTIGSTEIMNKDEKVTLDVAPYIENGTTFIPLRGLLELMGAEIGWDGDVQGVTIKKGDTEIYLQIRYKNVYVTTTKNGKLMYTLLAPPRITDNRTFVPIRFISEHLGYNVAWDGATQTVTITK